MREMGLGLDDDEVTYRGTGCANCFKTGYIGRIAVAEVLVVSEEIRRLIMARASSGEIRTTALGEGMTALAEEGMRSIVGGITTLSEVVRAVGFGSEGRGDVDGGV